MSILTALLDRLCWRSKYSYWAEESGLPVKITLESNRLTGRGRRRLWYPSGIPGEEDR